MARRPSRYALIVLGLLLTLGVGLLPLGRWGKAYSGLGPLIGNELLWWAAVVLVLLYVTLVERRPLSSIGFRRPTWGDYLPAIAAALVAVVGMGLIYALLFPALHLQMNKAAMQGIIHTPFWYRVLLVTRAAVAEEILFRGYPIPRVEELSKSRILAGVLTWAVFTYAHLS